MHPLKEGGVIDEGAAIKDVGAAPEVVYLLVQGRYDKKGRRGRPSARNRGQATCN